MLGETHVQSAQCAHPVQIIWPQSLTSCRAKKVRLKRILGGETELVPAATAVIGQAAGGRG